VVAPTASGAAVGSITDQVGAMPTIGRLSVIPPVDP
jgi:hypothetical protein